MDKELAKVFTTAIVRFIDSERPKDTMCCSNAECERLEKALEVNNFDFVGEFIRKKFSRPTEFEKKVADIIDLWHEDYVQWSTPGASAHNYPDQIKPDAAELLAVAREQLIKDGYVIEKKAFHDAVEKVDPEVMKEVSDSVDKENELSKKYLEGYTQGYKDAEKFYNGYVAYRNPTMPTTPSDFGCDGIRCTNPQMDCINCPRKTTGGFNTTSGTSTATLHGNTTATDGEEHNPSFTD